MTFHHVRAEALKSHDERQHKYARGGTVHEDEAQDKELIKEMVKPKDLKKGQKVEGRAAGGHVNRPGKAKTTVNVIIPPSTPPAPPPMIPPHPPVMAGPPPGPPPQMPPRPMPQPGMGPMAGPPPGGMPPPGMIPRARGGAAKRDMGGAMPGQMQNSQAMMAPGVARPVMPGMQPARRGGRAERARGGSLDAGAASGEGRIEKAANGRKGSMIEYGDD